MMKSFHNDVTIKELYVNRVKKNYIQDEIIQGKYWENGKGCAVGCTINGVRTDGEFHKTYEKELGIPEWLALLEDTIFEGLTNGEAKEFPVKFLQAIPVGATEAQFNIVKHKFFKWLLKDKRYGCYQYAHDDGKKAIDAICILHDRAARGDMPSESAWSAAESAARSAARSAAWSAARSSAESAAWSAAESAAWSAARSAQAKKLLQLLKGIKVREGTKHE